MVYKLLKVLYGLKQFFYLWLENLFAFFLKQHAFKQIHVDYSIFMTKTDFNRSIMSIFINNIKIIDIKKNGFIQKIKKSLIAIFLLVVMDFISF